MEPESSLPRLQVPATCPYYKRDQFIPRRPTGLLKFRFNIVRFKLLLLHE
jgi:hypothetical protein